MTNEQFIFWLKGFLIEKTRLSPRELEIVVEQLNKTYVDHRIPAQYDISTYLKELPNPIPNITCNNDNNETS